MAKGFEARGWREGELNETRLTNRPTNCIWEELIKTADGSSTVPTMRGHSRSFISFFSQKAVTLSFPVFLSLTLSFFLTLSSFPTLSLSFSSPFSPSFPSFSPAKSIFRFWTREVFQEQWWRFQTLETKRGSLTDCQEGYFLLQTKASFINTQSSR